MKQIPKVDDEVNVEVKGYSCDDDCRVYFEKISNKLHCGWAYTPHNSSGW